MADAPTQTLPPRVLSILRCPLTRSPLRQDGDTLIAEKPEGAGLRYPIKDGIPVLLMDEAELPEGVDSLDAFKAKYSEAIVDASVG